MHGHTDRTKSRLVTYPFTDRRFYERKDRKYQQRETAKTNIRKNEIQKES